MLTARLAERCDELVALDTSPTAVERARERVGGARGPAVATLPEELPGRVVRPRRRQRGPLLLRARGRSTGCSSDLEAALEPGGVLLAVHWRPPTRTYPLRGDEVHALLRARPGLRGIHAEPHERYRLDVLERT